MTWINGRKYMGDFSEEKLEGYGVFSDLDGSVYKGHWKNSLKHGEGIHTSCTGLDTTEVWENGQKSNQSKYISSELDKTEGTLLSVS